MRPRCEVGTLQVEPWQRKLFLYLSKQATGAQTTSGYVDGHMKRTAEQEEKNADAQLGSPPSNLLKLNYVVPMKHNLTNTAHWFLKGVWEEK